jgi:SOS-response transcriptional repressor LexA
MSTEKIKESANFEYQDRVKYLFPDKSLSEIASILNLNYHTLLNYLKGRTDFPTSVLRKIAETTNCSLNWLLTGEGPKWISEIPSEEDLKIKDGRLEKDVGPAHDVTIHKEDLRHLTDLFELLDVELRKASEAEGITRGQFILKMVKEGLVSRGLLAERIRPISFKMFTGKIVMVPVIGKAAAGKPIELYRDGRVVTTAQVWPEHWEVKAVEIDGESMSGDDIHDGDVVLYRVVYELKPHDLALVFVEDEGLTLKRVRKGSNGTVRLESSNPDFQPMHYEAQRLTLLGVVIATLKMQ